MPGPNPWEIIIGVSNVEAWDTKVLNHLVYITWACAGFSGPIFSLTKPPVHIYLDFNRQSLTSFSNFFNLYLDFLGKQGLLLQNMHRCTW